MPRGGNGPDPTLSTSFIYEEGFEQCSWNPCAELTDPDSEDVNSILSSVYSMFRPSQMILPSWLNPSFMRRGGFVHSWCVLGHNPGHGNLNRKKSEKKN